MKRPYVGQIEVYSLELSDIYGRECISIAEIVIDLDEIVAIRQNCKDDIDEIRHDVCVVYMKSGESFILMNPYYDVLYKLHEI